MEVLRKQVAFKLEWNVASSPGRLSLRRRPGDEAKWNDKPQLLVSQNSCMSH